MKVGNLEHPVARRPALGVLCSAELPGLDGYTLRIGRRPLDGDRAAGVTARQGLEIADNDAELTAALVDDEIADHLACLHRVDRTLVLAGGQVRVLGDDIPSRDVVDVETGVAMLCLRPVRLARRFQRLFGKLGGVASAPRWDTSTYHIELATDPRVRVDWPRAPGLVTRLRAETAARGSFEVIDRSRSEPRDGASLALAAPGVEAERYVCVARDEDALEEGVARLGPALAALGAAIPYEIAVGDSAVEVRFLGLEEQRVAIEPAVELVRILAGPGFMPGPYR